MSIQRNLKWLANKPDWHVRLLAKKLGIEETDPELLRMEIAQFHDIQRIPVTRAEMYTERLLSYWSPTLQRRIPKPDHAAQFTNSTCGDMVSMEARIEHNKIVELEFTARGCCMTECSAGMLVELTRDKTVGWVRELTFDTYLDLLGLKVEQKRTECVMTAFNCLKKLIDSVVATDETTKN